MGVKIDAPKDRYEVWVGDDLIISTEEKSEDLLKYDERHSGKNRGWSKKRRLCKVKILKDDKGND